MNGAFIRVAGKESPDLIDETSIERVYHSILEKGDQLLTIMNKISGVPDIQSIG